MRRLATPALLAIGFALIGAGPYNTSSETVHQPVVSRTDFTLDVRTDGYGHFAPGEPRRVAAWFNALRLGYGDHVSLDGAMGRDDLALIAADYGLLLDGAAPVTPGAVAPGTVRVVVSRSVATVAGCPDWSVSSLHNLDVSTMSNYGCATEVDLAAMVANPEDLVHGQSGSGGGADTQTVQKAIKVYRDADATGKVGLPGGITSVSVVKTGGQ